MKTYGEWRYSSTILELSTRWRWVCSFTPRQIYTCRKGCLYPLDRRVPKPDWTLWRAEKSLVLAGNQTSASLQPVACHYTDWAFALNFYMLFRFMSYFKELTSLMWEDHRTVSWLSFRRGINMSNKCLLIDTRHFQRAMFANVRPWFRILHSGTLNLPLFLISTKPWRHVELYFHIMLTSALDGGEWLDSEPRCFTSGESSVLYGCGLRNSVPWGTGRETETQLLSGTNF
jgi:hypothetical protein